MGANSEGEALGRQEIQREALLLGNPHKGVNNEDRRNCVHTECLFLNMAIKSNFSSQAM